MRIREFLWSFTIWVLFVSPTAEAQDRPDRSQQRLPKTEARNEPADELRTPQGMTTAAQPGDVFVAVGSGKVKHFSPDGALLGILDTRDVSSGDRNTTGMARDAVGNLYVTLFGFNDSFDSGNVYKFSSTDQLLGTFGSGYNSHPESIVIDAVQTVYIGQADGSRRVLKFSSSGTLVDSFAPVTENRGIDWMDLALDQRTLFYTSEGSYVKRYDLSSRTQLADFNRSPLPGAAAFALRLLPSGGLLVADNEVIVRLDSGGNVAATYDVPGENRWFALNLDPDGKTFWSAGYASGYVYRFDIATGTLVTAWYANPYTLVGGLAVYGEITTACSLTCSAQVPGSGTVGTPVSFSASATPSGCAGSPVYDWDFGDGLPHTAQQNASHTYGSAGTFTWKLTVTLGAAACTKTGTVTVGRTAAPYGVDANTVALWTFDDTAGQAVADSTGVNNGIATGTTIVPGRFGLARRFRGNAASDFVTVPDNPSLRSMNQLTIEAWIYPTSFDLSLYAGTERIVSKGDESGVYNFYALSIIRNDACCSAGSFTSFTIQMDVTNTGSGAGAHSAIAHPPGQWYYVAGTYDGSKARVYVNGVLEAEGLAAPGVVVTTTDPLYINNHTFFNHGASSNGRMGGIIDEVRISNVARSASEIQNTYATSGITQPPVVFVHGFCSDASTWKTMIDALRGLGAYSGRYAPPPGGPESVDLYFDGSSVRIKGQAAGVVIPKSQVYTITFAGPTDATIEQFAYQLSRVIDAVQQVNQVQKVDLVGHSMGGLVARAYVEGLATAPHLVPFPDSVGRIVTLDTPHQGTDVANLPLICNFVQQAEMQPRSLFLQLLNAQPIPPSVFLTAIASRTSFADDGVVSFASQDITAIPLYRCATNVETLTNSVRDLLALATLKYPVLHVKVQDLFQTAALVDGRLAAALTQRVVCQLLVAGVPKQVGLLGLVGDFVYHLVLNIVPAGVAQSRAGAGVAAARGCTVDVIARSESGAELARRTVPAAGIQDMSFGPFPGKTWHLELISTCDTTASVTTEASSGCLAAGDSLCLNGGRFRVQVAWHAAHLGTSGVGQAVPLTSDTGYLWFFQDTNVELVVKVLDGRTNNGHFWVFYGALSNVEYTITVTDTVTGEVKTYFNPQDRLASVADTAAFPLGAGVSSVADKAKLAAVSRERNGMGALLPDLAARPAGVNGACVAGPTALCLNDGRFRLEVAWRALKLGTSGLGQAVQLTSDTGYFWFFQDTNAELVIKVLDGRTINGKFWVFYGALSNVDYTITVTDTLTGAVKTYHNPQDTLASVADTAAF